MASLSESEICKWFEESLPVEVGNIQVVAEIMPITDSIEIRVRDKALNLVHSHSVDRFVFMRTPESSALHAFETLKKQIRWHRKDRKLDPDTGKVPEVKYTYKPLRYSEPYLIQDEYDDYRGYAAEISEPKNDPHISERKKLINYGKY